MRQGKYWMQWLAGNSKHIQSLIALATTLHGCLEQGMEEKAAAAQILTVNDFLFSKGLDNLNLFRLIRCVHIPDMEGLCHKLAALDECAQCDPKCQYYG